MDAAAIDDPNPPKTVRRSVWIFLAILPFTAFLIAFGRIHAHHGDTIVPVLMSLYHWTPFFWISPRFGMLLPLLAMPVRDPFYNLILQTYLTILASICVPFLLARYMYPRQLTWLIGSAALIVGFLTQSMDGFRRGLMLPDQPYSVGMCLAVAGLLCLEHGVSQKRKPVALATWLSAAWGLMSIAAWVNVAILFSLVPLVSMRAFFRNQIEGEDRFGSSAENENPQMVSWTDRRREIVHRWIGVCFLASAIGTIILLARWAPNPSPFEIEPMSQWIYCLSSLASTLLHAYFGPAVFWTLAVLGCIGMGISLKRFDDPLVRRSVLASGLLTASSVVLWLAISPLSHIRANDFEPRYMTDGYVMIQLSCVGLCVSAVVIGRSGQQRYVMQLAMAVLIMAAALIRFGIPSRSRIRLDLDRDFGKYIEAVEKARVTHIAGDYWTIWPTMYEYALRTHPQGSPQVVWGVTNRSVAIEDLIFPKPGEAVRIGVPIGQEIQAEKSLRMCHMWPCEQEETVGNIEVWRFRNQ